MDALQQARQEINDIDRQMAGLFENRMRVAARIAEYKKAHGLPILDQAREQAVIERNTALVSDPEVQSYYIPFQRRMMELSRQYQHLRMQGATVAYSGVEGAFANLAAGRIFPDAAQVSFPGFAEAYAAVEQGDCDCAVLPIENSYAGEVGQVMDLAFRGSLYVKGVYTLKITQNLLGLPDATAESIRTVISHPQALAQCAAYIREHGYRTETAVNTAVAACLVAEREDPTLAAIASRETARLYGLRILDHDIHTNAQNSTRFAVFSRVPQGAVENNRNLLLFFTVKHRAGALAEAIQVIGSCGFNMRTLRSRPMQDKPFQYYFFIEAEGDGDFTKMQEMLDGLSHRCELLKVLGSYAGEVVL